jgi:ATP synthase protein I
MAGWNIVATMLSGLLGFGLPAWLLARWTSWPWITGVGLVAGMAAALVVVWFRYGTQRPPD